MGSGLVHKMPEQDTGQPLVTPQNCPQIAARLQRDCPREKFVNLVSPPPICPQATGDATLFLFSFGEGDSLFSSSTARQPDRLKVLVPLLAQNARFGVPLRGCVLIVPARQGLPRPWRAAPSPLHPTDLPNLPTERRFARPLSPGVRGNPAAPLLALLLPVWLPALQEPAKVARHACMMAGAVSLPMIMTICAPVGGDVPESSARTPSIFASTRLVFTPFAASKYSTCVWSVSCRSAD